MSLASTQIMGVRFPPSAPCLVLPERWQAGHHLAGVTRVDGYCLCTADLEGSTPFTGSICYTDRMDRKEYMRRWYQKNKEAHKARVVVDRRIRRKSRRELVAELKNVPCADCGVKYPPYVMDFDHRGDKLFEISDAIGREVSLDRFLAEIAKCDVVCSNCHRERHHGPVAEEV
jgi:hypothetical protein